MEPDVEGDLSEVVQQLDAAVGEEVEELLFAPVTATARRNRKAGVFMPLCCSALCCQHSNNGIVYYANSYWVTFRYQLCCC
jgi:hypothetical protein